MNTEKQAKLVKEITDIKNEIDKICCLLNSQNWNELQKYLFELRIKYMPEVAKYTLINMSPPKSLQENALNCINFLNQLSSTKKAELSKTFLE